MNEEITLREVADYLDHVGIQFMATIGLDGKPKVRPMQYMVLEDEKLWFCTNSKKEVYAELQANPAIELCGCKLEKDEIQTPWIRFSAEVVFEERQDIRDAIIEKSAIVNALYKDMRQNPIFKVFYLKHIDGWLTNLGNVKALEHKADFANPVHFSFLASDVTENWFNNSCSVALASHPYSYACLQCSRHTKFPHPYLSGCGTCRTTRNRAGTSRHRAHTPCELPGWIVQLEEVS